jgi:AraC family transcriptional regulator
MSQVFSSHNWYRDGALASSRRGHSSVLPEVVRSIEAGPVRLINVLCPPAVVEPPVPEYAVHLVLRTPPLLQVGFNRPLRWLVMSPGVILVSPPDTGGDYVADAPSHVLTITIPKACVEDFTQDSGARIEARQEETFREPRLMRQIMRLWHDLTNDAPASRMFADQVMREVLRTLARRTDVHIPARHARERLATHTVRRLRDYVESSLAEDLDVTMLADVAGLSPAHFARAFAATIGMTPFHYVMSRRLARAHEMLERTNRSALDIALAVGFKTPSHFTARFHREFGVTPSEIRTNLRRLTIVPSWWTRVQSLACQT